LGFVSEYWQIFGEYRMDRGRFWCAVWVIAAILLGAEAVGSVSGAEADRGAHVTPLEMLRMFCFGSGMIPPCENRHG
jgi:hypothetical protein